MLVHDLNRKLSFRLSIFEAPAPTELVERGEDYVVCDLTCHGLPPQEYAVVWVHLGATELKVERIHFANDAECSIAIRALRDHFPRI